MSPGPPSPTGDGPGPTNAMAVELTTWFDSRRDRILSVARALVECRGILPADQREVFDLRHADGFSYSEIATTIGVPEGTVMSRLARALEKVRACLESKGVTGPASA